LKKIEIGRSCVRMTMPAASAALMMLPSSIWRMPVRPVTVAQQDDLQSVVANGLQAGERVVTTGFARLTEGTAVSVSSAEDAGQVRPADRARPDGTRGTRAGDKSRRNPSAGRPPANNP